MPKKTFLHLFIFLILLSLFAGVSVVYGKVDVSNAPGFLQEAVVPTALPTGDLSSGTGSVINVLFQVSGLTFFVLLVYAGLRWMTARGQEEAVNKARNTLIGSTIGLTIIVGSYALTNFVFTNVSSGVVGDTSTGPSAGQVGERDLGCCLDRVGRFVWAWRIDTQENCQQRGTDENDANDRYFSADDWQWHAEENAAQCERRWQDL